MKLQNGKVEFCFIDTETGGLNPKFASLIQLGALRIEVDVEKKQLVQLKAKEWNIIPINPVDPGAAKINGYDPQNWNANAQSLTSALFDFFPFLEGTTVAGWNADFDMRFIRENWEVLNWSWPRGTAYKTFEISTLCSDLIWTKQVEHLSLKSAGIAYGFLDEGDNPHSGLLDILLTVRIFEKHLRDKGIIETSTVDYQLLDEWRANKKAS